MNKEIFKPGNWYVCIQDAETEVRDGWIKDLEEGQTYYMSEEPSEFISKDGDYEHYIFDYERPIEEYLRPWTLEDAEPGDILKVIIDGEMYLVVYNGLSDESETMEGAEFRWVRVRDGYYNREREKFYDNPHSMFSRHYEKKKEWEEGEWTPATEYEKTILFRYARLEGYTFDYETHEFRKMTDEEIGNVHVPLSKAVPWLKEHVGDYSSYARDRFICDFVKAMLDETKSKD